MPVFGRLDVYYPDGRIETYPLDGDTTSVGRAEGNTVALDTETISRYHFSITHQDGVVQLTDLDSANGTIIDGTLLNSNEPHTLVDVEEIQIGHLRIIYHPGSDSPTIPLSPMKDDSTQPSDVGFRVSLETSHVKVWPASSSSVEIAVTNSTEDETQYQVVATGLPEGWAKINRPQLLIDGLDTAYILLNIKPARRTDTPPADYPVAIRISSIDKPDKFIELDLMVSLKAFGGFGVALSPEVIQSDEDLHLYMLNQGNEAITVSINGHDPTQQLRFELPSGNVQIAPGQRTQVTGRVQPQKRPLVGKSADIPFALVVNAHTDSAFVAAVPGTLQIEPSLSNWMLGTVSGIVVSILLILAVFLSQTPEPQIQTFTTSSSQVAQGKPVDLNWTAIDAERFVVEVNRVPIQELDSNETTYSLNTHDYGDPIDVALIAVNGDVTAIVQTTIDIYVPITINSFGADRSEILRNVNETIVVGWNVSGSVSTNLMIPEGFMNVEANPVYEAIDTAVLQGVPQSDFIVTLSLENEIGAISQSDITITTVDPECTPIEDALLFEGPAPQFTEVGLAPIDVPVIVSGINSAKDWLRVELASGVAGWGLRASFVCDSFEPDNLVVIVDVPILPTSIPTLQNTPTSIPTQTLVPTATEIPTLTAVSESNPLRRILFGEN